MDAWVTDDDDDDKDVDPLRVGGMDDGRPKLRSDYYYKIKWNNTGGRYDSSETQSTLSCVFAWKGRGRERRRVCFI